MQAVKCKLKDAEKIKRYLLENKVYNKEYKPKKSKEYLFFPLINNISLKKFSEAQIVETILEKVEPRNYKEYLFEKISKNRALPSSYDIVGDIIIIDINEQNKKYEKEIANALLKSHKNIKTVLKKVSNHGGEFRTQKLGFIAGQNKKETTHTESGVRMKLDVEKTYFSTRLGTERKRIASQIKRKEKILVMFSGIGVYPLVISKNTNAEEITGIEKNPIAHKYAEENLKLNKTNNIKLYNGDVRKIVPKLAEKFDRIIMPLPKEASGFL
ncbi:MAG: methyltransferase, partial [Nanoarchaeota archaeon]